MKTSRDKGKAGKKRRSSFSYDAKKGLGDGSYLIEYLMEKRPYKHPNFGNIIQYKVKWVGYKVSESTWEPSWNIPDQWKKRFESGLKDDSTSDDVVSFDLSDGSVLFRCAQPRCSNVEGVCCEFQRCSGCSQVDDETAFIEKAQSDASQKEWCISPRYCSAKCQQIDWQRHRVSCPAWSGYQEARDKF